MDDVEIPAKPVARADAGECQDRDDQHGEQPRRNNRSGPARVGFGMRVFGAVLGHLS